MTQTFTALDHLLIAVSDLDAATTRYAALFGREPEWRGEAPGARHVWFQLGNTALDILAPEGEGPAGAGAKARIASAGEGLWAMAFATPDLEKARHRLERVGVRSTPVFDVQTARTGDPEDVRRWKVSAANEKALAGATLYLTEPQPLPPALFTADAVSAISGLDHVVIRTPNPERAIALYGGRLGLEMRLDRSNPDWGQRLLFFRLGDLVVEIAHDLKAGVSDGPDEVWGLSWRTPDVIAAQARMAAAGFNVSETRQGRKPGTAVFTVRDAPAGVPTLIIGPIAGEP